MPRAISVEKKLAIAEAKAEMWQEQANGLSIKLAEALAKIETDKAYFEANYKQAKSETTAVTSKLTAEREENNGLRSIIRDLELTVERHRGYQDAQLDAQPPRMVPEVKEPRRANWPYPASEVFDPIGSVIGSANSRAQYGSHKPWWHR